jgi:hypothetical protein
MVVPVSPSSPNETKMLVAPKAKAVATTTNAPHFPMDVTEDEPPSLKLNIAESLSELLKSHQKEAIQSILSHCFAHWTTNEDDKVSGCILAHHMGLGMYCILVKAFLIRAQ